MTIQRWLPARRMRGAKGSWKTLALLVLLIASFASGELVILAILRLPDLIRFIARCLLRLVRPVVRSPRTMTGPMKACMAVFIGLVAVTALRWFAEDPASDLRLQAAIWSVILAPLAIAVMFADDTP